MVGSACSGLRHHPDAQAGPWQVEAPVQVIDGPVWVVGTHVVTLAPEAAVAGNPSVGATVQVSGRRTENGELIIDHVQVVQDPAPTTPSVQAEAPAPPASRQIEPSTEVRAPAPAAPPAREKKKGRGRDN
jgi:hypothetical protein